MQVGLVIWPQEEQFWVALREKVLLEQFITYPPSAEEEPHMKTNKAPRLIAKVRGHLEMVLNMRLSSSAPNRLTLMCCLEPKFQQAICLRDYSALSLEEMTRLVEALSVYTPAARC